MIDFEVYFDMDEKTLLNQCENFSSKENLLSELKSAEAECKEIYEIQNKLISKVDKLSYEDFNYLKKSIPFNLPYDIFED